MAKNGKMNQDFPIWFDGKSINEALFCEDFLQERKVIFTDRASPCTYVPEEWRD